MISTYMDFEIVKESERESIMALLNANNFSTNYNVIYFDGAQHLEANSAYICLTTSVTESQYQLFLKGSSIENRIDRFKFYGENYAKLPSCLSSSIHSDDQSDESKMQKDRGTRKMHSNKKVIKTKKIKIE